jgi:acetoin utilization protein AcuB
MKIRDIMRPGPYTIHDTEPLGIAHRTMARARVRHLPVIDGDKLVGILSERDVLAARARAGPDDDWWAQTVRYAMKSPVQTAGPDDSLTEVAGRMAAAKIGAMPVVELGKLIGLVTATDVLDAEVRSAMAPAPSTQAIVADAMTPWPITVGPQDALLTAVERMADRHVRHMPVVDATSALVGMVSDRDIRTAIGDPAQFIAERTTSPAQFRVKDIMTKPAVAIPFDQPLIELARSFTTDRIGAVPVVDRFGALIGIVSYVDALRVLAA